MRRVALATSLHLDHGWRSLEQYPSDRMHMQDFVPIGLLSLKAAADRAALGLDVNVVEVNSRINSGDLPSGEDFFQRLAACVLEAGDDLVGLMTDADSLHHTVHLARVIKQRSPRTHICLGGPGATPVARDLLNAYRWIDTVVRGEGEVTFVELLQELRRSAPIRHVAGLSHREGGIPRDNPSRPLLDDLDTLPIPAYGAFDMAAGAPLYLDVGRGCPYKCQFCATAPYWERKYRMKTIDRIIEEMVLVRDRYGRNHVNFSHDVFTAHRAWVLQFCAQLESARLGVTWSCSTRTDLADAELLNRMAAAGCVEIYYGIESGSQKMQRSITKDLDLERSRQVVIDTRAASIRPVTGFIVGYPEETEESLGATVDRFFDFLELGGFRGHIFTLCPFPGSPLHRQYAATLDREAEYYDLPLPAPARAPAEEFYRSRRDLFSSVYRYATPQIDSALVDACEELSPHLVVLKALWPLLLTCYPSGLDWLKRWTRWIAARNASRSAAAEPARFPHQGDARDLLDFVDEELARLELTRGALADLARYERGKLDARDLRLAQPSPTSAMQVTDGMTVRKRCDYFILPFRHDLARLLHGDAEDHEIGERWVVFARTGTDGIDTLQTGAAGRAILERAALAQPVDQLLDDLPGQVDPTTGMQLVRFFVKQGLLMASEIDT